MRSNTQEKNRALERGFFWSGDCVITRPTDYLNE